MTQAENKAPIKRMVRDKHPVAQSDVIRKRMIMARIMNGYTAVHAAELLGYKNSTQLSLIESGGRPVPKDWTFILKMSGLYCVSVDFLLGVSPNPERDAIASEHFALMRGMEDLLKQQMATITSAMVRYAVQGKPSMTDFQKICEEVEWVSKAVTTIQERNKSFENLRGGASLVSGIDRLAKAVEPIKGALGRRKDLEKHMMAIASGKEGPLSYLLDGQPGLELEG
jgi:hypothetical protein